MTKLLTGRFGALLLCTLVASGCSQAPYTPAATTPFMVSGILSGGALQSARIETPQDIAASVCPGQGRASCEVNWKHLKEGQSTAEVANLIGQPAQQGEPDIYIEKVVAQWRYQDNGVVYFENDELRSIDLPTSFEYAL